MITSIYIDGFKSFKDFYMEFKPLTVIAGVNGSGKSNLFDALNLLGSLSEDEELYKTFSEQRGTTSELFTRYSESECAHSMIFTVQLLVPRNISDNWGNERTLSYTRLEYTIEISQKQDTMGRMILYVSFESLTPIKRDGDKWIEKSAGGKLTPSMREQWIPKVHGKPVKYISTIKDDGIITLHQDGKGGRKKEYFIKQNIRRTILSGINSIDFAHALAVKQELQSWRFMQLSPQDLRQPTSYDKWEGDTITQTGKNLASALYRIKESDGYALKAISRRLSQLVSGYKEVLVENDTVNKQYVISVKSIDNKIYSSRVLSEGTLRLLALCILCEDNQHTGLLCFEEPENGINPQRIHLIMDLLKDLTADFTIAESPLRQVIINTHSPAVVSNMINWMSDNSIGVWIADMSNLIHHDNSKVYSLMVTRMNKVDLTNKENTIQGNLFDEEKANVRRYTLNNALRYLSSKELVTAYETIQKAQEIK